MQSGIYKITSILFPDRFYIGSAKNLRAREKEHYRDLRRGKHVNKRLQNHANKYGHYDLIFAVIERTENLIPREQFYIDQLNPSFNICRIAGNTQERPQSPETRRKRSEALKGRKYGKSLPKSYAALKRYPLLSVIREFTLLRDDIERQHSCRINEYKCTVCGELVRYTQKALLKRVTHHCIKPERTPKLKPIKIKPSRKRKVYDTPRIDGSTGYVGITLCKRTNKFRARLTVNGKKVHAGYYDTAEQANEGRIAFVRKNNIPYRLGSLPTLGQ